MLHKKLPTDQVGQFLSMIKFEQRTKLQELPDMIGGMEAAWQGGKSY